MSDHSSAPVAAKNLEALLFALGRPLAREEAQKMLGISAGELAEALTLLQSAAKERGVVMVEDGRNIELRATAGAADIIERVRKEEYSRDIGRAGLEILAAVLYRGPLTRSEIDFIRGVNSSQSLRTLAMRGLLRKVPNPRDERSYLYEPTTELLAEFGAGRREDLPEYATVRAKLAELEASHREADEPTPATVHAQ